MIYLRRFSLQMNKFEYVSSSERNFDLPTRATAKSAGYDFHSPVAFILKPGEIKTIKLEVKLIWNVGSIVLDAILV